MRRNLRRYWHLHAIWITGLGLLIAVLAGAFAGAHYYLVHGQKLDKNGVRIYKQVAAKNVEKGQRDPTPVLPSGEALPPAIAEKVTASNDQVALGTDHPHPLATPEPSFTTSIVRNQSSRGGTKPIIFDFHSTESYNVAGTNDDKTIVAWFNNPGSQASANYVIDCEGNAILMVAETAKAWTVAYFNRWSISIEYIGHASQSRADWLKCDAQLRKGAQIAAAAHKRWGIPIQQGLVRDCTILRAGYLQHSNLGACGGGHHDAGPGFPMDVQMRYVAQYAAGGFHPKRHPKPKPVFEPTAPAQLRAKTGYWSWLAWRVGQAGWKGYGHANPTVRPHVPVQVPALWWRQAAVHLKGAHQ